MSRLSLLVLFTIAAAASADSGIVDKILRMQPMVLKHSATCPVPIVGQSCPKATEFYYFSCCGEFNKDCCLELQDWINVSLILILASLCVLICACGVCVCRMRSN